MIATGRWNFAVLEKEKQMTLRLFRTKHWSQHRGKDGSVWHREKAATQTSQQELFMTFQHRTFKKALNCWNPPRLLPLYICSYCTFAPVPLCYNSHSLIVGGAVLKAWRLNELVWQTGGLVMPVMSRHPSHESQTIQTNLPTRALKI